MENIVRLGYRVRGRGIAAMQYKTLAIPAPVNLTCDPKTQELVNHEFIARLDSGCWTLSIFKPFKALEL
jgi:hypothetical protein